MAKILTEDMIEKACIERLGANGYYDFINAFIEPNKVFSRDNILDVEDDGTGRDNIKEVILPNVLERKLKELNPQIPDDIIQEIVRDFRSPISSMDLKDTNYNRYKTIKHGIKVEYYKEGKKKQDIVRIIAFNNPYRNSFTLVSQMWIKGSILHRRPDLILFINGLPLVFIELKNSDVKVKTAYDKNLKDYLRDIPNCSILINFA